jgi:hypothetical protein
MAPTSKIGKDLGKATGASGPVRRLAEPLDVTGREVTKVKIAASAGVVLMLAIFLLVMYLGDFASRVHGPGSGLGLFLGMLVIGLTTVRAATSGVAKLVFKVAPVPVGSRFQGSLSVSRGALWNWVPALIVLLFLWGAGSLGPPLVASSVTVGCCCLAWVWALRPQVLAIDSRTMSEDEVRAERRLSTRVRREANYLLSQWLSAVSTGLAIGLVIFGVLAVATPPRLQMWRWALAFAFAYLIIGSLLRAAAETSNRLWIDIDVVRLWKVSWSTALAGAAVMSVGGFVGAIVGGFVWLASHLKANGQALDMLGRWAIALGALGAVIGVMTAPKLAFIRRRELRRQERDEPEPPHRQP